MRQLLEWLFGCRHRRLSFPLTMRPNRRPQAGKLTGTYVTCLDCGREFPYDWQAMKRLQTGGRRRVRQVLPLINADQR